MILTLKTTDIVNDFFTFLYTPSRNFVLNMVKENFVFNDRSVVIQAITIQIESTNTDGTTDVVMGPNIIGLGDTNMIVRSDYPELQGVPFSMDNIEKCYIELYE